MRWGAGIWWLVPAASKDVPSVQLLGNRPATGADGSGVHLLSTPMILPDVNGLLDWPGDVVPCDGPYQLRALDSCSSARHGHTAYTSSRNSQGIWGRQFHDTEDDSRVDSFAPFQSTRLTSKTMLQSKKTAGGENETPRRCHPETQAQSLHSASEVSRKVQTRSSHWRMTWFCRLYIGYRNRGGNLNEFSDIKTKPGLLRCQMAVVSDRVPSAIFWRA